MLLFRLFLKHYSAENVTEHFNAQWLLYVPPGLTFTNSTFCPHSVFMCFVWISEQTAIVSLYSINWLVFITETECLLRGTSWVTISYVTRSKARWLLYIPPGLTSTNPTLCPHSVFMCFVCISEQTAIVSLYSINWLVFITERKSVYYAVGTEYLNGIQISLSL
jgi:hypothetical protein